jgi:hypothetical protein
MQNQTESQTVKMRWINCIKKGFKDHHKENHVEEVMEL